MSNVKNKNQTITQKVASLSAQAGIIMMAAAATAGVMDMNDHQKIKVIVPNQPIFAYETENTETNNPVRSQREETAPHFISYNVSQRTPGRHGRV
ncbi:MAG: hypothetical protein ACHQT9_05145 [Candidatus Saccharimonadales bacterium]